MDNNNTEKATSNGVRPAPPGQDSDPNVCLSTEEHINHGPVPRKTSNKEIYAPPGNMYRTDEDVMAPLGFEPEGSATKPSFCEGCLSLRGVLGDRFGYRIFHEYLRLKKEESLLDFWRSCEEFRRLANARSSLATSKANSIFNNYMHTKHPCGGILHDGIRAKVKHALNSGQSPSESMFDSAQEAIYSYINETHFAQFIRSDVYKHWAGESSVKISTKDRVSAKNGRFLGPGLPPLPEEKVLALEDEHNHCQWTSYDTGARSHVRQVDAEKDGYLLQTNLSKAALAGMSCQPAPPVVSVNDSDVQSLSSDALTDDSKSTLTDYSDLTSKSAEKKRTGQGFQDGAGFVPRTKRLPKDRKQLTPEEFAKILIPKLEKVVLERQQEERAAANLASVPREHFNETRREKSILEAAAENHNLYTQAGRLGLTVPPRRFNDPSYPVHGNRSVTSCSHLSYQETHPIPRGYYPVADPLDRVGSSWKGCVSENSVERPQHAPLGNTKKQWESVGTIESAPDSGVSIEDELALPPDKRTSIFQWMEQGEKETQLHSQHPVYTKNSRSKHAVGYNVTRPRMVDQRTQHMHPMAENPHMPPLAQPNARNTLEEASRKLSQKNPREKRSKSHHKNRSGYGSSRSSHAAGPQFSSDSADCASSVVSGDYLPAAIYNSSSVLSSVPSTVNSCDSGLGSVQRKKQTPQECTKVLYQLADETVPYQSSLPGKTISLRQFKDLITFKKGKYRYFFKKETDEEDCGAVYEEILDDDAILPCYGNKIVCKVKEAKSL